MDWRMSPAPGQSDNVEEVTDSSVGAWETVVPAEASHAAFWSCRLVRTIGARRRLCRSRTPSFACVDSALQR